MTTVCGGAGAAGPPSSAFTVRAAELRLASAAQAGGGRAAAVFLSGHQCQNQAPGPAAPAPYRNSAYRVWTREAARWAAMRAVRAEGPEEGAVVGGASAIAAAGGRAAAGGFAGASTSFFSRWLVSRHSLACRSSRTRATEPPQTGQVTKEEPCVRKWRGRSRSRLKREQVRNACTHRQRAQGRRITCTPTPRLRHPLCSPPAPAPTGAGLSQRRALFSSRPRLSTRAAAAWPRPRLSGRRGRLEAWCRCVMGALSARAAFRRAA